MARTERALSDYEEYRIIQLRFRGYSNERIALTTKKSTQTVERAIERFLDPYRKVTKQECNPRFSTENDSGPKIRCRCCGNLATRVCKSDARKCVACDMRGNVLRNENGDSRRF
jgi:IS30 family transposase